MQVLSGSNNPHAKERKTLLAKVHIAKKELALPDGDYRAILEYEFNKRSAADLTILELEYLVDYFRSHGWQPRPGADPRLVTVNQLEALRVRARAIAAQIENGERRLRGLTWSQCGVEDIRWCRSAKLLKRLLAALEKIRRMQVEHD